MPIRPENDTCSMQMAAKRSGLTPQSIRAWERRYRAISPDRSSTAHRVFSEWDVQRLTLLRQAVQIGHRISDVADLATEDLFALVAADTLPGLEAFPRIPYPASRLIEAAIAGASKLHAHQIVQALLQGTRTMNIPILFEELIAPLQRELRARRRNGSLRPVHERFAAAHIRNFLGRCLTSSAQGCRSGTFIVAAHGEAQELDALMAVITATHSGWECSYLGANLQPEELAYASRLRHARGTVLCLGPAAEVWNIERYARELHAQSPDSTALVLIGVAPSEFAARLAAYRVVVSESLGSLHRTLLSLAGRPSHGGGDRTDDVKRGGASRSRPAFPTPHPIAAGEPSSNSPRASSA